MILKVASIIAGCSVMLFQVLCVSRSCQEMFIWFVMDPVDNGYNSLVGGC